MIHRKYYIFIFISAIAAIIYIIANPGQNLPNNQKISTNGTIQTNTEILKSQKLSTASLSNQNIPDSGQNQSTLLNPAETQTIENPSILEKRTEDYVFLRDGSLIKGKIFFQDGNSIKIRTAYGEMNLTLSSIQKIEFLEK